MISNAVEFDQVDEILRRIARESRLCEMTIGGKVIVRASVNIGEIAATAARNQDLLADFV